MARPRKPASLRELTEQGERWRDHHGRDGETEQHRRRGWNFSRHHNAWPRIRSRSLCLRVEQRAAGVTTAPTNVGTSQAEIVQPVFANGAGAFLGISRPVVAQGDSVYPVLATRPDVGGPHSDSSDVPETDSTFDADLLAPERVQASTMYRRVDAARFPGMDAALRMALNSGLEEKLDYEVLRGVEGLLTGAKLTNHNKSWRDEPRAVSLSVLLRPRRWPLCLRAKRSQGADGKSGTYAHAGSTYQTNPHMSALDALMAKVPVRVSAHVPAVASTKQNNVIRLGFEDRLRAADVERRDDHRGRSDRQREGRDRGDRRPADEHEDPQVKTDSTSSRHRSA